MSASPMAMIPGPAALAHLLLPVSVRSKGRAKSEAEEGVDEEAEVEEGVDEEAEVEAVGVTLGDVPGGG
ncbi:hypothetical protein ACWCXH_09080 [Kitasatospora sp. NPDC001660]